MNGDRARAGRRERPTAGGRSPAVLPRRSKRRSGLAAEALAVQRAHGNRAAGELLRGLAGGDRARLGPAGREAMEARVGGDLADVRIHAGPAGTREARAHGAVALTRGSDVYLDGSRGLWTAAGEAVLAHELAHVRQQAAGAAGAASSGEAALEGEARAVGDGHAAPVQAGSAARGLPQRADEDEWRRLELDAPRSGPPRSASFGLDLSVLTPNPLRVLGLPRVEIRDLIRADTTGIVPPPREGPSMYAETRTLQEIKDADARSREIEALLRRYPGATLETAALLASSEAQAAGDPVRWTSQFGGGRRPSHRLVTTPPTRPTTVATRPNRRATPLSREPAARAAPGADQPARSPERSVDDGAASGARAPIYSEHGPITILPTPSGAASGARGSGGGRSAAQPGSSGARIGGGEPPGGFVAAGAETGSASGGLRQRAPERGAFIVTPEPAPSPPSQGGDSPATRAGPGTDAVIRTQPFSRGIPALPGFVAPGPLGPAGPQQGPSAPEPRRIRLPGQDGTPREAPPARRPDRLPILDPPNRGDRIGEERMPDAVRLPGTRQETLIAGPATVDEYLGVVRNQVQPATSFGVGWDHDRFPRGPTAGYRPGDPIDMPDREGAYPTWDTIRTRLWRNRAYFELAARTRGAVRQRDESMLELDPLENLTQQQLEELLATGATPTGFEVEHERIPQRVGAMLERAGLPAEQARRLAHVGDPSNLLPVRREQHAVWDEVARRWRTRNPTLERAFDDRDEFPLGSMREEEVQALLRALRQGGIDLSATQAGRELRGHLRIENERRGLQRRGGPWQIP